MIFTFFLPGKADRTTALRHQIEHIMLYKSCPQGFQCKIENKAITREQFIFKVDGSAKNWSTVLLLEKKNISFRDPHWRTPKTK